MDPRRKEYRIHVTDRRAAQRIIVERWWVLAEQYAAYQGCPGALDRGRFGTSRNAMDRTTRTGPSQ